MRIIYTIAITVIIAVLLAGCAGGEKTLPQKPKTNIKVAVLEPNGFANYTQIIGIVEPLYDVPVIAEESGTLTSIRIDKGEYVRKGQTIAVLTSEVLTAQLHQAHAAYASDSLNYAQQAQLQEVRGISEVQLQQLAYKRNMSLANFNLIKARHNKLRIKATVAGIFDDRSYDLGTLVPPGAMFGHIVNTRQVKVRASVAERFATRISTQNTAVLTFDAIPKREYTAAIDYVGTVISPNNRTFPVEIVFDNKDGLLRPNMVANVDIRLYEVADAIVIPKDAIIDEGTDQYVFVKSAGYALKKRIEVEDYHRRNVLLSSGLAAGDSLIVSGHRDLVDSSLVQIVDED